MWQLQHGLMLASSYPWKTHQQRKSLHDMFAAHLFAASVHVSLLHSAINNNMSFKTFSKILHNDIGCSLICHLFFFVSNLVFLTLCTLWSMSMPSFFEKPKANIGSKMCFQTAVNILLHTLQCQKQFFRFISNSDSMATLHSHSKNDTKATNA